MSNNPASTVQNFASAPNWVKAADNHNVASSGVSIFSAIGDFNPASHITVSAISGLNSLYNSVAAMGAKLSLEIATAPAVTAFKMLQGGENGEVINITNENDFAAMLNKRRAASIGENFQKELDSE